MNQETFYKFNNEKKIEVLYDRIKSLERIVYKDDKSYYICNVCLLKTDISSICLKLYNKNICCGCVNKVKEDKDKLYELMK